MRSREALMNDDIEAGISRPHPSYQNPLPVAYEELHGYRIHTPAERLNAQCDYCGEQIFGKPRHTVDTFRARHENGHFAPECVTVWEPFSENPLSEDSERYLLRWLPEAHRGYTLGWQHGQHDNQHGRAVARWTEAQA